MILLGLMPRTISSTATASARCDDRRWLYYAEPERTLLGRPQSQLPGEVKPLRFHFPGQLIQFTPASAPR